MNTSSNFRNFVIRPTIAIAFILLATAFNQAFGQISGTYTDNQYFYMFEDDGDYTCYSANDMSVAAQGSYEAGGGVMNFYNQYGRLVGSYYARTSGKTIVLTDQGGNAIRLKYYADNEDFAAGALIGLSLQAILGN